MGTPSEPEAGRRIWPTTAEELISYVEHEIPDNPPDAQELLSACYDADLILTEMVLGHEASIKRARHLQQRLTELRAAIINRHLLARLRYGPLEELSAAAQSSRMPQDES